MDKLKGNWACPWLTLPVASGNATETQDVLNNGLPEILAGLSDTWSLHPLSVADEVSGESSWQLVAAIPDNGDGLTLCEWHSEGLDGTHSCCVSFGFFRTKRTVTFKLLLWSFLSAISKMGAFLAVRLLTIWQCSILVHSLCSTGGICGTLIWYCITESGHSPVCPSQPHILLRMCHSIAKNFRPNSLTAVSYCTPMPDSSAWGSVWVIWMRRFLTFGLSIRVSTSRWMYLKWLL
jgi:hypothetical protein